MGGPIFGKKPHVKGEDVMYNLQEGEYVFSRGATKAFSGGLLGKLNDMANKSPKKAGLLAKQIRGMLS